MYLSLILLSHHRDKNSKSERLFDLDVTEYPELQEVSSNMDKLSVMYDVYAKWKVNECFRFLVSRSFFSDPYSLFRLCIGYSG